jgi:hypothetical protein
MRVYKCNKCDHVQIFDPSREETDERRFQAAVAAMQGLLAKNIMYETPSDVVDDMNMIPPVAVKLADMLLKELEKGQK